MNPRNYKHGGCAGGTSSPEYRAYRGMIDRCYNPNSDHWAYYGARGVKVDPRWLGKNGFKNFLRDMGPKPLPLKQYTLGRILDGPIYSKETCEWMTWTQQGAERRGANAAARLHYYHLFPAEGKRILENFRRVAEFKARWDQRRKERAAEHMRIVTEFQERWNRRRRKKAA